MQTSTDIQTDMREALDRLAYWAGMSTQHLPDGIVTDELIDAVHAARQLLDQ